MSFGVQGINPLHYPLCPLNTGLNDAICNGRAVWHPEEVIRSLHVHGAEDRNH